jgi:hypothetical protein
MPTLTTNSNTASAGVSIGKDFLVAVAGTFDGATLAVQYASNGAYQTYQSGETGSFTAAGERRFANCGDLDQVNLALSSAGANTSVHAVVTEV